MKLKIIAIEIFLASLSVASIFYFYGWRMFLVLVLFGTYNNFVNRNRGRG